MTHGFFLQALDSDSFQPGVGLDHFGSQEHSFLYCSLFDIGIELRTTRPQIVLGAFLGG